MTYMEILWKMTLLLTVLTGDSLNIDIADSCEKYYYMQSQSGDGYFLVQVNRTFYDCSSTENTFTDTKSRAGARTDKGALKNSFAPLETRPQHQLFYNTVSKRIEANISWEFDTASTGYVLQIVQNVDKGHGHKTCLNINVNRVTGYFYGKHNFPTDVFVRCIGVWSESSEDYSITIWQKQSKNCPCPVSQTQTDISCNSSCTMEPERERNSFNFNFIQDACFYWGQNRSPNLFLKIKQESRRKITATVYANNVNPYTDVTLALFENENPRFPLFEIRRPRTQSTSFMVHRAIHSNHSHFYAAIYYFCNGSNKSATVSYMSNDVHIENVVKLSRTLLIEDTSNDQGMKREGRSTILGALIAIACISIGLLTASVLFYRNKTYGLRRPKSTRENSEDKMWEELHLNNTEAPHSENVILQPSVAFTIGSEEECLSLSDKKSYSTNRTIKNIRRGSESENRVSCH